MPAIGRLEMKKWNESKFSICAINRQYCPPMAHRQAVRLICMTIQQRLGAVYAASQIKCVLMPYVVRKLRFLWLNYTNHLDTIRFRWDKTTSGTFKQNKQAGKQACRTFWHLANEASGCFRGESCPRAALFTTRHPRKSRVTSFV